jgi:hypothetical protein
MYNSWGGVQMEWYRVVIPIEDGHSVIVDYGIILQGVLSRLRLSMISLNVFGLLKPSNRTVALELTLPLTEMSAT